MVKIGETDYTVMEVKRVEYIIPYMINLLRQQETVGQINYSDQEILIKKTKEDTMKAIYYHEIAHGLFYELSKKHKSCKKLTGNEELVDDMAEMLDKIFKLKVSLNKEFLKTKHLNSLTF